MVLFGEQGVGNSSLAGLVPEFWSDMAKDRFGIFQVRYNCDKADNYQSIWSIIAENIRERFDSRGDDHLPLVKLGEDLSAELFDGYASPYNVRRLLDLANKTTVIVIDEFDQVTDFESVELFASTFKNMSDNLSRSTLILARSCLHSRRTH